MKYLARLANVVIVAFSMIVCALIGFITPDAIYTSLRIPVQSAITSIDIVFGVLGALFGLVIGRTLSDLIYEIISDLFHFIK